jgi:hypothetical protein
MMNPLSLCWAIAMWAYAFLGAAMWFTAGALRRTRIEKVTAYLFVVNGILSIAGACVTTYGLTWVLAPFGLICFALWNLLMATIAVLVFAVCRKRSREIANP